jgi:molybdopterin converting factor small subunit
LSKNKIILEETESEKAIPLVVKFLSHWPAIIGNDKTIDICVEKGTTISDLLDFFNDKYGDIFTQIRKRIVVLINSHHITALDGLDTQIKENDKVVMFIPYEGG